MICNRTHVRHHMHAMICNRTRVRHRVHAMICNRTRVRHPVNAPGGRSPSPATGPPSGTACTHGVHDLQQDPCQALHARTLRPEPMICNRTQIRHRMHAMICNRTHARHRMRAPGGWSPSHATGPASGTACTP